MDEGRPDPARARSLTGAVIAALAFFAVLLVVLAVATDTYILLTGLIAVAGGAVAAFVLLRTEESLDEHP